MRRRFRVLAPMLALAAAVAGCADIGPPSAGVQAARFGVLITWDAAAAGDTTAAQDALVARCGLPAPTGPGPGGARSSAYVRVPSGKLPDTQADCLTAGKIVTMVDILSGPAPGPA